MSDHPQLPLSSDDSAPIHIGHRSSNAARPTIAVLMDYMTQFVGSYEAQFRDAFHLKCREYDLNLFLVYGGMVDEPYFGSSASVGMFDLVQPSNIDGVILMSSSIGSQCGADRLRQFAEKYHAMSACSVGLAVPGIPSIVVDNRGGMEAMIEHVIRDHGHRRVLFLGGPTENPEAQLRLQAYLNVLKRHDLVADPALMKVGNFIPRGAQLAMEEVLAQGLVFDAVVAANDSMALSAIYVLLQHGRRVPRDMVVTGFDNLVAAGLGNPPLTTVAQPFEAMADQAIRILLDRQAGAEVRALYEFPTDLVVRRSCGCDRRIQRRAPAKSEKSSVSAAEYLRRHGQVFSRDIADRMGVRIQHAEHDATRLVTALQSEFDGQKDAFIRAVEEILEETGDDRSHCRALESALAYLRENLRFLASPEIEDLWHDARDRILVTFVRGQTHHRVDLNDSYWRLIEAGEQLSYVFDLASLKTRLIEVLPRLRIPTAFVSQYIEGTADELEALICLVDGHVRELPAARYPARELFPAMARPDRRHTALVFPVDGKDRHVGVAIFEYFGQAVGQQLLRNQICAALASIRLHHEMVEQKMQNERNIQERAATLKRMQSLSVLAGGVAHDLNNALGPLVALPDVILSDLEEAGLMESLPNLRADVESIKASALRAAQTIKDLLTLGRQGRTRKDPLDIVQIVAGAAQGESLRFMNELNPQVHVTVDVPQNPLVVRASESHLVRAISNLIRNAVEAISGGGEVAVKLRRVRLVKPYSGYETVDPGDYAAVSVTDSGSGISDHDLSRIFEPFFSRKRVGEQSGSGLGLAIVHGVVKEHEGFVDVASTLGAGTTFTLYFPCSKGLLQTGEYCAISPRGQARILMVDDEAVQLRTGSRILQHLGYQVDTLASGEQAHARFVRAAALGPSPYDLLILDMVLGEDRDGLAIFEEIQRLFPAQKAIVASGHAPTERAELAMRKGLAWLAKPYTHEALAQAVHAALLPDAAK
jgi:DNA-binding LacI/PurR family transcriptional regulator/nitrogen-specific signal transduction histidine kinase/ActR/RegA family two-component response regulator